MPETSHEVNALVVSAPGKVLLAGGYLVLDRDYAGQVFALSARINVIAQPLAAKEDDVPFNEIVVTSPQFLEAEWVYRCRVAPGKGGIKVTQLAMNDTAVTNRFVEVTLSYVLTYVAESLASHGGNIPSSRLTILADNDYYSHGSGTITKSSVVSNPQNPHHPHGTRYPRTGRFPEFATTLQGAHKTGLGSSAALVTALTGALLAYYLSDQFDISTEHGKGILHNLAQAAHCAAQGKVGSGFDVAAAVYGSCVYRRFSPAILGAIPAPGDPNFATQVTRVVSSSWDTKIKKERTTVALPPGVILRMADVDQGTQTVGMVKKVLEWRENHRNDAVQLWGKLQVANDELGKVLVTDETEDQEIRDALLKIRMLLRDMGTAANAPIEPPSQTKLLDAVGKVEGVLGGLVPGAGGYDAVALLMKGDDETKRRVEVFLQEWGAENDINVKLLGVTGESEGARLEPDMHDYLGWC